MFWFVSMRVPLYAVYKSFSVVTEHRVIDGYTVLWYDGCSMENIQLLVLNGVRNRKEWMDDILVRVNNIISNNNVRDNQNPMSNYIHEFQDNDSQIYVNEDEEDWQSIKKSINKFSSQFIADMS